jgi:hypothetical protein
MKDFKLGTFIVWTFIIGLLTFVSFMLSWDNSAVSFPWVVPRIMAFIFGFPSLIIMQAFFQKLIMSDSATLIFMVSICLNCALYGLLIERIIYFKKKKSKFPAVPTDI